MPVSLEVLDHDRRAVPVVKRYNLSVVDPAAPHREIPLHNFSLSASFAPDGTRFVAGLLGTADVFDATEELEAEHPFRPDSTSLITVSPNGRILEPHSSYFFT